MSWALFPVIFVAADQVNFNRAVETNYLHTADNSDAAVVGVLLIFFKRLPWFARQQKGAERQESGDIETKKVISRPEQNGWSRLNASQDGLALPRAMRGSVVSLEAMGAR